MSRETYRWLSRLSAHCRFWLFLSVFLGVINGVLIIEQALVLASIIYKIIIQSAIQVELLHALALLLIFFFARAALSWAREVVNCHSAIVVKTVLHKQLLNHTLAVGPVPLGSIRGGALSNLFLEQIEAVHDFYANYLPQMVLVAVIPILILVVVFPKSWMAGLILLFTAPLIPLFMAFVGMGAESRSQKQFQKMAKMSGYFLDVLRGLVTLKLFKSSREYLSRIAIVSDAYRKNTLYVLRIAFLSSAVLELFSSVAIAILAVYLGLGLLGIVHLGLPLGAVNLKNALFILLLAPEFFLPLRQLGTHYHARAQAIGAAIEIHRILNLPVLNDKKKKGIEHALKKTIVFDNVNFRYNDGSEVLNHFNFIAEPGAHTVIVGESGVGKSTILNLISAFLVPNSGLIKINGQDLQSLDPDAWRYCIALVGQNTRLFSGTLYENLRIAKPDAGEREMFEALEIAHLDDVVRNLPRGLNTVLGEGNMGLSQGQIQRVALCRAYLNNASVLLLDEATANLDRESEAIILSAVKEMSREKTVISVSHREQTMTAADILLRLDAGVCV